MTIKMSDAFGKVAVVGQCLIDPDDLGEWCDFSECYLAEAAALAINNHDRLAALLEESIKPSHGLSAEMADKIINVLGELAK